MRRWSVANGLLRCARFAWTDATVAHVGSRAHVHVLDTLNKAVVAPALPRAVAWAHRRSASTTSSTPTSESTHAPPSPASPPLDAFALERELGRLRATVKTAMATGNLVSAKDAASQFLEGATALYGRKHSVVASALNNLALVHKESGDLKRAVELYEEARVLYEELVGPQHPSSLVTATNIGVVLRVLGEQATGLERKDLLGSSHRCLQRVVDLQRTACGPNDPNVFRANIHLAATLRAQRDYDAAKELLTSTIATLRTALGPSHPILGLAMNNLGFVLKEAGQRERALECYEEALHIRTKSLGPSHVDTLVSSSNLAELLLAMGHTERATKLQADMLAVLGVDVPKEEGGGKG